MIEAPDLSCDAPSMLIVLIVDIAALARGIAYRLEDGGHAVDLLSDGLDAEDYLRGGIIRAAPETVARSNRYTAPRPPSHGRNPRRDGRQRHRHPAREVRHPGRLGGDDRRPHAAPGSDHSVRPSVAVGGQTQRTASGFRLDHFPFSGCIEHDRERWVLRRDPHPSITVDEANSIGMPTAHRAGAGCVAHQLQSPMAIKRFYDETQSYPGRKASFSRNSCRGGQASNLGVDHRKRGSRRGTRAQAGDVKSMTLSTSD